MRVGSAAPMEHPWVAFWVGAERAREVMATAERGGGDVGAQGALGVTPASAGTPRAPQSWGVRRCSLEDAPVARGTPWVGTGGVWGGGSPGAAPHRVMWN